MIDIYKTMICLACFIIFVCMVTYYTQLEKFRSTLKEGQIIKYKLPKQQYELGRIIEIKTDSAIPCIFSVMYPGGYDAD